MDDALTCNLTNNLSYPVDEMSEVYAHTLKDNVVIVRMRQSSMVLVYRVVCDDQKLHTGLHSLRSHVKFGSSNSNTASVRYD